jgi:hydrogenase/urease accessory protein HupE
MAVGTRTPDVMMFARARTWKAACFAAAFFFGLPVVVRAHDPGLSSLDIRVGPHRVVAVLSLAAADARAAVIDSNGDLEKFAVDSIELQSDGVRLSGAVDSRSTDGNTGISITLVFGPVGGSRLTVRSAVPARLALGHRQLVTVRASADRVVSQRMLDARMNTIELALGSELVASRIAGQFVGLGLRHILSGFDHLLFLAALLLGVRRLRSVVKTVTAFTLAHSLTLSLAVVGLVDVPSAVVEPLIAASIVFVGLENLVREPMDSRWKLTFAFGLVHGFGFAGALRELGVGAGGTAVAAPLGWFNAGVEVGQIGVVLLLWPLIRHLNARPALRIRVAPLCSLLVVAAGSRTG